MIQLEVNKPLPLHPRYQAQRDARDFWRRSDVIQHDYAAGKDAAGSDILPQHWREVDDRFRLRKSQAMARRYCRPILDRYNDHAFRQKVTRSEEQAEQYAEFLDDATGTGATWDTLIRGACRVAQREGAHYILADHSTEGVYRSAAQVAAAGDRGIVRPIPADSVPMWRDWLGEVVEAIVVLTDKDGGLFAWHVTDTECARHDLKEESGQWIVKGIGEAMPHSYGRCPLVRLSVSRAGHGVDPGDDSQAAAIADAQKRILNLDSWLWEELISCTFTVPVFLGVAADAIKPIAIGPGKALCVPSGDKGTPALAHLSADPAQADSLRKTLEYEIRELYRVAGLSPGSPTEAAQPESGVAKAFAFNEVEARLSAMASACEHVENLIVEMLSTDGKWQYPGDATWPNKFDTPDAAAEIEQAIRIASAPLPQVLKDSSARTLAARVFSLNEKEQAELETQIKAGVEPPADPFSAKPTFGNRKPPTDVGT